MFGFSSTIASPGTRPQPGGPLLLHQPPAEGYRARRDVARIAEPAHAQAVGPAPPAAGSARCWQATRRATRRIRAGARENTSPTCSRRCVSTMSWPHPRSGSQLPSATKSPYGVCPTVRVELGGQDALRAESNGPHFEIRTSVAAGSGCWCCDGGYRVAARPPCAERRRPAWDPGRHRLAVLPPPPEPLPRRGDLVVGEAALGDAWGSRRPGSQGARPRRRWRRRRPGEAAGEM